MIFLSIFIFFLKMNQRYWNSPFVSVGIYYIAILLFHFNGHVSTNTVLQREMTISVDAGTIECFFETIKEGHVIDLEYQVIDGAHGDLDISFEIHNPDGHRVAGDYKKSDNMHRIMADRHGDHRFCFDNSFSSFNRKTVFFELYVESTREEDKEVDEWGLPREVLDELSPDENLDMKVFFLSFFFFLFCLRKKG